MNNIEYIEALQKVRSITAKRISANDVTICGLLIETTPQPVSCKLREWIRLILIEDADCTLFHCRVVETTYSLSAGIEANTKRLAILDEMIEALGEIPESKLIPRHHRLRELKDIAFKKGILA